MQRIAAMMIRRRTVMFVACLLTTAAAYPLSQNIRFDQSVRSLFAENNPHLIEYYRMVEDFGSDAVCLAVYADPELLSAEGMRRLDEFARSLRSVPGVSEATSVAELPRPQDPQLPRRFLRRAAASVFSGQIDLDRNELFPPLAEWFERPDADIEQLRNEILQCDLYRDVFIGRDGQTAAVVVNIQREAMASGRFEQTLQRMRQLAAEHPYSPRIVGSPVLIGDVYDYLAEDSHTLTTVSTATMALVILLLFRSIRWVILPMLVVQCSLIWTRAFMAFAEIQMSLIGTMMTALVTVIGIATCIHLAVRYQEESQTIADPEEAFESTLQKVAPAIFWTCATTAAGFGALGVSSVLPVKNFAAVMSLASMAVAVTAFMLVPGGVLMGGLRKVPKGPPGEKQLSERLQGLAGQLGRHSVLSATLAVAVLSLAASGLWKIQVETDFTRYFRDDSPVLEGYRFVENNLGGAGSIQLVVDAPELTPEYLQQVAECQEELKRLPGVTKVTTLTDLLSFFDNALPAGSDRLQRLLSPDARLDLTLRAIETVQPTALARVWNADRNRLMFEMRVNEQQEVAGKERLLADIRRIVGERLDVEPTVTGMYVLLTYLIDSLLSDQRLSFLLSATGIFAMMCLAFRDVRLGFVAFAPNIVPIVVVLGAMGWLGIRVNVATAMIGSISMGLVVDFSIHYLNRFRQERKAGADFYSSMARTHRSTGKAMVFANLALMIGFGVLATSQFVPTMHFGSLVSLAILGGLIGNLSLLPVLLRLVFWVKRPTDQPAGESNTNIASVEA